MIHQFVNIGDLRRPSNRCCVCDCRGINLATECPGYEINEERQALIAIKLIDFKGNSWQSLLGTDRMDDDSERLFEQVGYRGVAELATWQRAWLDEDAGGKFVRDREAYKKFFAWSLMQKCLEAVVNPNG